MARGDRRSCRRSDAPKPGRSMAKRRACSASEPHMGVNAYTLSGQGLVRRIVGSGEPPYRRTGSGLRRRYGTRRVDSLSSSCSTSFIVGPFLLLHQLLATVYVEGCAGYGGVDHEVQCQGRDERSDDPPYREFERSSALRASRSSPSTRGEWRVHEARRDQVDSDRRHFDCEVPGEGRKRGGKQADERDPLAVRRPLVPPMKRRVPPGLTFVVASLRVHLDRYEEMGFDVVPGTVQVELFEWCVVRAGAGYKNVVEGTG